MPRKTQYPRLITRVRKGKNGQQWTYYFYDKRPDGEKDISLGSDRVEALKKWDELHNRKPRIAGTLLEAMELWELDADDGLLKYTNTNTIRNFKQSLKQIKPVFGPATWDTVEMPHLIGFLRARKGKTQANRDLALLSIVWNFARKKGLTKIHYPAAGMQRSKWKNKEYARLYRVTDEVFDAIYKHASPMLRDCMDLATATGLRLTDCRTIALPKGDTLTVQASKNGKGADYDLSLSVVLPDLIKRRRALSRALHTMLLSQTNGRPVTESMLRYAYDTAREKAVIDAFTNGNEELAQAIKKMILRDCRKRAASLSGSIESASELLQHSNVAITKAHYWTERKVLKPVR